MIAIQAIRKNKSIGITGVLYHDSRQFFQKIEGEPDVVTDLFAQIEADERHRDVIVLYRCAIPERRFAQWSLKVVDGDSYGHVGGYFAYERLLTADIDAVRRRVRLLERL
jgi:hypothetical protein